MADKQEKKTKQKRYRSINRKMYLVIVLLVFFAALISILYTAQFYVVEYVNQFATQTTALCESSAEFFKDDQLNAFTELIRSETFRTASRQAYDEHKPELIDNCIKEAGLEAYQEETERRLKRIEENNVVNDMYIAVCENSSCYYVLGMNAKYNKSGEPLMYEPHQETLKNHVTTSSSYTRDTDGSYDGLIARLVTMSLITTSPDGTRTIWLVGEDDTKPFLTNFLKFLQRILIFLLIVSTVFAVIGVLILRRQLTSPIIKLKRSVVNFEKHNSTERSALPMDPGINRPDEIGDLSSSLYSLEQNVYETQTQLAKLSEEKGRMSAQLSIAASIQQGVLPSEFPKHECFDLYGLMQPAKEVGGDFFDYFFIDEDHLAMVIGDVSDKGIPASLFMMTSKTLLKTQALSGKKPSEVLAAVNNQLSEKNPANYFVTVWLGILNLCNGHMIAANGGHEFPIVSFGGMPFMVYKDTHGMALGSMPDLNYKDYELQFREGDRMIVYSDGATDAINTEEQDFGIDNLEQAVEAAGKDHNAEQLVHGVLETLMDYSRDTYQFDDITLLSVTYLKQKTTTDPTTED